MTDTVFAHPAVTAVIAAFLLLGIVGKLMKVSFERIARWYLYVSLFSVVVVMNSIFFPFIGGKDYFFRFATELSLISVILWWAFETKKGDLKKRLTATFHKPIVIVTTVFSGIFVLACLFANDASAAFWSNYERGEGGFQMLHYYLFFLLLVFLFNDEREWKNLFKFSLVSAGFMILYGLAGNYSVSGFIGPYAGVAVPTGWWHQLIDGRFQGSLGNPAYVDPYLIFSMFYLGYLWTSAKIAGKSMKVMGWVYGVLIAIALLFFALGQTRGAFIGLIVGVFALLVYIVSTATKNVRKWSALALGIFVILGIGLYTVRNTTFVQNLPEGRLLQLSVSDSTAQTRFWVWDEAWKGFLERPILGWGPENFSAVFDKFFDPRFYVPSQNSETWFDRAHSIYLDYLAETGILGLLSYLSIFVAIYWAMIKNIKNHPKGSTAMNIQKGLIIALPLAYLVQGAAIFDVFPIYINLFLFFAFVSFYVSTKNINNNVEHTHGR